MGRPRKTNTDLPPLSFKEQQMDFNDTIEVEDIVEEIPKAEKTNSVFNRVALSIAPHPETGKKHVVQIEFNDKGEVGKLSYLFEGDGMDMARERFKIEAQMKILKSE